MSDEAIQVVSISPAESDSIPPGVLRLDYRSGADGLADWALLWPPESGTTWIVNLHGYGSHGDQLYVRADIRRDWLPEFRRRGLGVLTPNLRDNAWMSPAASADLRGLLQSARERHGAGRFVFVGGSMGGTGNLVYAVLHPEDVAGVAALCPATDIASLYRRYGSQGDSPRAREFAESIRAGYGGTPDESPRTYERHSCLRHCDRLTMPVFLAHGEADGSIPVGDSRALAAACAGQRLKYVEIPGGDHDAPLAAPIMQQALDWVLGRGAAGPPG
ncbi:MAG TPA: alpha/beta fold hydrolase [Phycisphaerae bacterium]|nr:alpha/beta fold hydrolase [Phycisphaerae bacterium]